MRLIVLNDASLGGQDARVIAEMVHGSLGEGDLLVVHDASSGTDRQSAVPEYYSLIGRPVADSLGRINMAPVPKEKA